MIKIVRALPQHVLYVVLGSFKERFNSPPQLPPVTKWQAIVITLIPKVLWPSEFSEFSGVSLLAVSLKVYISTIVRMCIRIQPSPEHVNLLVYGYQRGHSTMHVI